MRNVIVERLLLLFYTLAAGVLMQGIAAGAPVSGPPDYWTKLAVARTNCQRNDIVGIWVTRGTAPFAGTNLGTMQFFPDGTGYVRVKGGTFGPVASTEWSLSWSYAGNGVWRGTQRLAKSHPIAQTARNFRLTWRLSGKDLLIENSFDSPLGHIVDHFVAVRANDDRAVEAHLRTH